MRSVKSARTFPIMKKDEGPADNDDEAPLFVPDEEDYLLPDSFGDGYDLHFQELGNAFLPFHVSTANILYRGW